MWRSCVTILVELLFHDFVILNWYHTWDMWKRRSLSALIFKIKTSIANVSTPVYSRLQDKLLEDNVLFSTNKLIYLCSAYERFYRRKNNEKKYKSTSQEPRKQKQSEEKILLEQCWRIFDPACTCFICGFSLSNKSVTLPINARLRLFIEDDIYISTEEKCCSHHLVGSYFNPDF